MPLTPEDVSNKRFTPVRLREGYDMGEVDQFLDEVEAELARLTRENEDLRQKLSVAQQGGAVAAPAPVAEPEPEPEPVVHVHIGRIEVSAPAAPAQPHASRPREPRLSLADYLAQTSARRR